MSKTYLLVMAFCGVLSLGACTQKTVVKQDKASKAQLRIEDYYPLKVGNRWTYRISSLNSKPKEFSVRIVRKKGNTYFDSTRESYLYDSYGLRNNNVRYMLKYPLRTGTRWYSVTNITAVERYVIVDTTRTVKVPAGEYQNCLVVKAREQRAGKGANENLFIFAPNVGLVKIVTLREQGGQRLEYSKLELVDYVVNREG